MTEEKIIHILDNVESDLNYYRDKDRVLEASKLLSEYVNQVFYGARSDVIYGPDISELANSGIEIEDIIELAKMSVCHENGYLIFSV